MKKDALNTANNFVLLSQNNLTNALSRLTSDDARIDPISGNATIKNQDIIIKISNYEQLAGLRTSTHRLIDAIIMVKTERYSIGPKVTFSLSEYMELCGKKDRKEMRRQVQEDLATISNIMISGKIKLRSNQEISYTDIRLCDTSGLNRAGTITVILSVEFEKMLKYCTPMPYTKLIWRVNPRYHPNAYYLLRKILEQKNMNIGKRNEDIVSVQTLMSTTPYLPDYQSVITGDRKVNHRIIKPLERDLDALADVLSWEYCHPKGVPMSDSELEKLNYHTFAAATVKITWKNYPDQTERMARKKQY